MDLSYRPVIEDDISMSNSSSRATPMENNDADSDDLQFVDDLNMEPLEESNTTLNQTTAVSSAEDLTSDPLPEISTEPSSESVTASTDVSASTSADQISVAGSSTLVETNSKSEVSDLPTLNLSASQTTLDGKGPELSTNNTEAVDSVVPGATGELSASIKEADSLADQPSTNTQPLADVESSQSSSSDKPTSPAPEEAKTEPTSPTLPSIIKHFIEGFTIEESCEPFPVSNFKCLVFAIVCFPQITFLCNVISNF